MNDKEIEDICVSAKETMQVVDQLKRERTIDGAEVVRLGANWVKLARNYSEEELRKISEG